MPTAAKMFAALAFAFLGFFTSGLIVPLMPEGTQFGYFSAVTAAVGALTGWLVMGGLTGHDYRAAAGSGIRVSLTMVFWCLLILSIYEMVIQSMDLRYKGPFEAVLGVFDIAFGYVLIMMTPMVVGTLLIGGAICGMVTEWSARRWS